MKHSLTKLLFILVSLCLSACAVNPFNNSGAPANSSSPLANTESNTPVGGNLANNMDEADKQKLSRALDSAPGKATSWSNVSTGTSYTVVPTKKISINGNPFCREYNLTASRGGQTQEVRGNACVTADGDWHSISG